MPDLCLVQNRFRSCLVIGMKKAKTWRSDFRERGLHPSLPLLAAITYVLLRTAQLQSALKDFFVFVRCVANWKSQSVIPLIFICSGAIHAILIKFPTSISEDYNFLSSFATDGRYRVCSPV
jgi:hypothetical protein